MKKFLLGLGLAAWLALSALPSLAAYNEPVGCAQMPALTGAITSSAGSCATTLANVTNLTISNQLTLSVATGTAPMVVSSTTNVANLNASSLSGATFASPGPIGSTTPGTGAFTTLNSTGIYTSSSGRVVQTRVVTASGAVTVATTDFVVIVNKATGAPTTVNLPSSPTTGTVFVVKDGKGDAATNNITVTPAAGNIDGASTLTMNVGYESVNLVYNGTQWNVF